MFGCVIISLCHPELDSGSYFYQWDCEINSIRPLLTGEVIHCSIFVKVIDPNGATTLLIASGGVVILTMGEGGRVGKSGDKKVAPSSVPES